MKAIISAFSLVALLSSSAFASSKVCYGANNNDATKGQVLNMTLNDENVALRGEFYNGTYPALAGVVEARTGKTYLQYKGEFGDQLDIILVDKDLMKQGTGGLIQFRSRGEGYFNSVFFCRDANQ